MRHSFVLGAALVLSACAAPVKPHVPRVHTVDVVHDRYYRIPLYLLSCEADPPVIVPTSLAGAIEAASILRAVADDCRGKLDTIRDRQKRDLVP